VIDDPVHARGEMEEQQSAQRLVLSRPRRGPAGPGSLRNSVSSTAPRLCRVALSLKHDVPASPGHVPLLGASAAMVSEQRFAHPVEQTWLARSRHAGSRTEKGARGASA